MVNWSMAVVSGRESVGVGMSMNFTRLYSFFRSCVGIRFPRGPPLAHSKSISISLCKSITHNPRLVATMPIDKLLGHDFSFFLLGAYRLGLLLPEGCKCDSLLKS